MADDRQLLEAAARAAGTDIKAMAEVAKRLADKMMRDSWATGDDAAYAPAKAQMNTAIDRLAAVAEAAQKDAELWRKWVPYLNGMQRKPFNLAKDAAAAIAQQAGKETE
jgi:hypothetical protein